MLNSGSFDLQQNELLLQLVQEWKSPQETGEPDIVVEEGAMGTRVFVVWDAWEGIGQSERSEIITRAFELVNGKDQAELLTVALGLTHDESARLGLPSQNT
jgi:hypothetical protein